MNELWYIAASNLYCNFYYYKLKLVVWKKETWGGQMYKEVNARKMMESTKRDPVVVKVKGSVSLYISFIFFDDGVLLSSWKDLSSMIEFKWVVGKIQRWWSRYCSDWVFVCIRSQTEHKSCMGFAFSWLCVGVAVVERKRSVRYDTKSTGHRHTHFTCVPVVLEEEKIKYSRARRIGIIGIPYRE